MPGAKAAGDADPGERLEVTVLLRRGAELPPAEPGKHVDRATFAARYGATKRDVGLVRRFATDYGLAVVEADAARRTVILSGTVANFNAAFGVRLKRYVHPEGTYRGRVGTVSIPGELKDRVVAVLGLDDRPQAKTHFRVHAGARSARSFTPQEIASLYDFPASRGRGECIAIIEMGGGFRPRDLTKYFTGVGIPRIPHVVAVSVDNHRNRPAGTPGGVDAEVLLDIEVAGAVAPDARIVVYFAPNTDAGFLNAVTTAIHDTVNAPTVLSISWGGAESTWTRQGKDAMDAAFHAAAHLGITVCVASGDDGSTDGVRGTQNHVDFPASAKHALACGGTTLRAKGDRIAGETVWNRGKSGATGGGVSRHFDLPAWQRGLTVTRAGGRRTKLTRRGTPDVCGVADPRTGYRVRVDGKTYVIGGTSAVAPLWAGLIARLNALIGRRAGFIQPLLYASPGALADVTSGTNRGYAATVGWDACTGLGRPRGRELLELMRAHIAASRGRKRRAR
ncbi:MAG TPA: S53 family peptidase [Candidatus Elarobacter sp.]|nr:S53 family peptidase [Candidatus Elarobacter sp.]